MNQSQETKELFTALCKAQAEMKGALKDSKNPFFKSSYADLESCWEACRVPLTKNGLSIIQTMDHENNFDFVVTTLAHHSGQWIRGKTKIAPTKANDPQAMGSAITYARRYALAAIVGLVQVDDDGEAAMGRVNKGNSGLPPIRPEDPGEGNGITTPDSYKITFGKYAQRSLEDVGPEALRSYVTYLETTAKKKNQPITGQVADFIKRAEDYIGAYENGEFGDTSFP